MPTSEHSDNYDLEWPRFHFIIVDQFEVSTV